MSERTSYAPGTPCWVDLATPDVDAGARFYGELLGWEVPELPNSAEMGGYRRAKKGGRDVAGMMPLMQEGQPPAWSTYVAVEDADATARAVTDAGGSVLAEPMDVMDLGRMAVFADPAGAVFGIWQPGTFGGAELVNEPGTLSWNELNTGDAEAAKRFYGSIFGWEFEDRETENADGYTICMLDGNRVAGMLAMADRVPSEVSPHWNTYFTVEDTEAAIEQVEAGGGAKVMGPMDVEVGRIAVVHDPWGAVFSVIRLNP
jgi:uncharacterized protein